MDGKYILVKLIEVMENDVELQTIFGGEVNVDVSGYKPVGNTYPQTCLWIDEGRSETVFPAGHYRLFVRTFADKEIWNEDLYENPEECIRTINARINRLINRKASSISEINVEEDIGLRIVHCIKQGGDVDYNDDIGKYCGELCYKVVQSEDESFDPSSAGNKEWV